MKTVIALILGIALSGCATTQKFDQQCASWLDHPLDQLVEQWGVPTRNYQTDGGLKMIEYVYQNGSELVSDGFGGTEIQSYSCKVSFTAESGIIKKYSWVGNSCRSK